MNTDQHSRSTAFIVTKETPAVTDSSYSNHSVLAALFNRLRTRRRAASAAVGVVLGALVLVLPISAQADDPPPYEVATFSNHTTDSDEAPYTQAGGHPDQSVTEFSVDGSGVLNGTYVTPPLGFIGNPAAAPPCLFANVKNNAGSETDGSECPPGARVGTATVAIGTGGNKAESSWPLYNLTPEHGFPAQFGFKFTGTNVPTVLSATLLPRTESYGLAISTPNIPGVGVTAFGAAFYGTPSQHGSGNIPMPFLSNQVDCSNTEPKWSIAVDSIEHAGALREVGVPDLTDPDWKTATEAAAPVTGCEALVFQPSFEAKPQQGSGPVQADQPTGLRVDFDFPQTNDPTDPDTISSLGAAGAGAQGRDREAACRARISPSSADGLQACSDRAADPAGDQVHYGNTKPVDCPMPQRSERSPPSPPGRRRDPVDGHAAPNRSPVTSTCSSRTPATCRRGGQDGNSACCCSWNSPLRDQLQAPGHRRRRQADRAADRDLRRKPAIAGEIPSRRPQGRPRAPLMSPVTCGKFDTTSVLVPWSTPVTPDANPRRASTSARALTGPAVPARPAPLHPDAERRHREHQGRSTQSLRAST